MSNVKITMAERKIMRERGKAFLKTNPSVKDCVEAFIKYGDDFAYAFMPSDENKDKFPEYMIKNEVEIKKVINDVFESRYLKFDIIVYLLEIYEGYGELEEYLEIISKKETPNIKNIKWFKFFKEKFTFDFRDELNYDFEELIELIEM